MHPKWHVLQNYPDTCLQTVSRHVLDGTAHEQDTQEDSYTPPSTPCTTRPARKRPYSPTIQDVRGDIPPGILNLQTSHAFNDKYILVPCAYGTRDFRRDTAIWKGDYVEVNFSTAEVPQYYPVEVRRPRGPTLFDNKYRLVEPSWLMLAIHNCRLVLWTHRLLQQMLVDTLKGLPVCYLHMCSPWFLSCLSPTAAPAAALVAAPIAAP